MTGAVYLDSGIFIAFLNKRDRWHAQAVTLFGTAKPGLKSSVLVVSEAYSWFLHRMGEESARTFVALLDRLTGLHLYEATKAHHAAAVKMLNRYRGSKLTYRPPPPLDGRRRGATVMSTCVRRSDYRGYVVNRD